MNRNNTRYRIEDVDHNHKCYECGGPATIVLVNEADPNDWVPLCEDCAEKREV